MLLALVLVLLLVAAKLRTDEWNTLFYPIHLSVVKLFGNEFVCLFSTPVGA